VNRPVLYVLSFLVLVADQMTKGWVSRSFAVDDSRPVIPGFFSLTYIHNTGGAFGILPSGTNALALVAAVAAIAIVVYSARARMPLPRLLGLALALPLGGALGNLADRLRLHYVVDFFDLHVGTHQWPVFNVADSAICLGVAALAIHVWRQPAQPSSATAAETE
jgi:signal peptidase II